MGFLFHRQISTYILYTPKRTVSTSFDCTVPVRPTAQFLFNNEKYGDYHLHDMLNLFRRNAQPYDWDDKEDKK